MAGKGESMTSPRRVAAALRRTRIVQLRAAGMSNVEIARREGITEAAVRKGLRVALEHHGAEDVALLRAVQTRRLDELRLAVWQRALGGHLDSVHAVLAIERELSKLHGTYAPARQEHIILREAQRLAEAFGMTVDEVLAEVDHIMRGG